MITRSDIRELYREFRHWNSGAISPNEILFIRNLIRRHKPKSFLEIGTGAGVSTGFIARFLHENSGNRVTTIDIKETSETDDTKLTGFLAEEIYPDNTVEIEYHRGVCSTFLCDNPNEFNASLIDANNGHPWPTIDAICVLPFLSTDAILIHHDLQLYKNPNSRGVGPKVLFDRIPEGSRVIIPDKHKNMFYIAVTNGHKEFKDSLANSIRVPWTVKNRIPKKRIEEINSIIQTHWDIELLNAFEEAIDKFNHPRP